MTSAIKTLPGVQVNSIGYHGGEYGAGTQYNTTVTINGDDRVVICLDGRRVDNAVSGLMSSQSANWTKALANLDQVTSIDNGEVLAQSGDVESYGKCSCLMGWAMGRSSRD